VSSAKNAERVGALGTIRGVGRDLLIYGSGDVIVRASALLTLPIYTRILTPAEYGVWAFVLSGVAFVLPFMLLGGDSAYSRYFFEAETLEDRRLLTSTWLIFLTGWSVGVTLLVLPAAGDIAEWSIGRHDARLFAIGLLVVPATVVTIMLGQALRNEFRAVIYSLLSVFTVAISISFGLVAATVLGWGVTGVVAGTLLGLALVLPFRVWSARHLLRPVFSTDLLRDLLSFGVPLVPISVAWWVFSMSDRIILGRLTTLHELGLYSVAITLSALLGLLIGSLGQAWTPHAVLMYERRPEEAPALYGRMLTYILGGFGALAVFVSVYAHELLRLLTTPEYENAAVAIPPLSLGLVALASTQITGLSISLRKRTRYLALYAWIAAVINVGLNFALVPHFGMTGSAWATTISYGFLTLAYAHRSQKLWPIHYETYRSIVIVALTLAFALPGPYLPHGRFAIDVVLKAAYLVAYLAMLVALRAFDRREWRMVASVLRREPDPGVGEAA
jgi:O-antigen/teichoic acid export membrane protein